MKMQDFMDGNSFFVLPSMIFAFFMDGSFVEFYFQSTRKMNSPSLRVGVWLAPVQTSLRL